jgi:hypothetical protein
MVEQSTAATRALADSADVLNDLVSGLRGKKAPAPSAQPRAQALSAPANPRASAPRPQPAPQFAPQFASKPLARPAVRRVGNTALAALPEADEDGWTEF